MSTKKTMSKKILLATLAIAPLALHAQDYHLAQYDAAPVSLNPALTGMYEHSDFRLSSNVRSQWNRISNNFLTTAFSYDMNMDGQWGVGAYMSNYDQASMMKTFEVGAAGAYNVSGKGAKHTLSVGLKAGLMYKKINDADLLFDAQYNGSYFDADLPNGENIQKRQRLLPEVALGMAYRSIDLNKTVNPFFNFAVFHITRPDESIFRTEKLPLPMRWSVNGGASVKVNDEIRVTPMALFMLQGKNQEINLGMMGECNVGSSAYKVLAGGGYRFGDAVIAQAGLKHRNNIFRVSYDINVSPLSAFTNNMGAFEFSVIYCGTHSGKDRRIRTGSF